MKSRSPWSFSTLELLTAVAVAIVGILAFYWSMQDPNYFMFVYTCSPLKLCCGDGLNCDIPERPQIFRTFFVPLGCILAVGCISLVRAIRNDISDFSQLGHWAMAWPLFTGSVLFIGGPMLTTFFVCMWPIPFIGLILAIVASIKSIKRRQDYGNLSTIFVNLAVLVLEYIFVIVWEKATYIQ